jgi:hypothetical protein
MMESIKRWIAGESSSDAAAVLVRWAREQNWKVARMDEGATCLAEGLRDGSNVRIEWGPAQRSYLGPVELRLRSTLEAPPSLQMLVLSTRLAEQLELQAYQRLTDDARTELDVTVPEEMRWLTMLPRIPLGHLSLGVRACITALASHSSVGAKWLDTELASQLAAAPEIEQEGPAKLSLILHRGRLTLRLAASRLDADTLRWANQTHALALQKAIEVSAQLMDSSLGGWATTASATWQTQMMSSESLNVEH